MAFYTFKWTHPATEVYVTGTFDDWGKTVKLDRQGDHFEKRVPLPDSNTAIHYKFVVDGVWTTDHTAPQADDGHNNLNNVLTPDRINKMSDQEAAATAFRTGVTPESTTASLAQNVPKGGDLSSAMPGGFPTNEAPEPTTAGLAKNSPKEDDDLSSAIPGGFPETPFQEAPEYPVQPGLNHSGSSDRAEQPVKSEEQPQPKEHQHEGSSGKADSGSSPSAGHGRGDDGQQTFGVNPLPATAGAGNPINLKPGEPVPHPSSFTTNTVHSAVTLDKESYEKSGSLPFLPPVVTPQDERDRRGTGLLDLPPIMGSLTPGGATSQTNDRQRDKTDANVHISSAAPESSTAALAAQVPLEPKNSARVPEVVEESQREANVAPEASAYKDAVQDKKVVEDQLALAVKPVPPVSEGVGEAKTNERPSGSSAVKETTDDDAAASEKDAGAQSTGKSSLPSTLTGYLPSSITHAIDKMSAAVGKGPITEDTPEHAAEQTAEHTPERTTATGVPDVVSRSIDQAHQSPEAAANEEAVKEKQEMERELLSEVQPASNDGRTTLTAVPGVVARSIDRAHQSPEAAANDEAVAEKREVERELLREVKPAETAGTSSLTAVPDVVARSIDKARQPPEAAANAEAVAEKGQVERELLAEVKPAESEGQSTLPAVPAVVARSIEKAHQSPEAAVNEEAVAEKRQVERELLSEIPPTEKAERHTASAVPYVVTRSIDKAHESPEAAANEEAVAEKEQVERELLREVKPASGAGEPAPSLSPALSPVAPAPTTTTTAPPPGEDNSRLADLRQESMPSADELQAAPDFGGTSDEGGLAASAASPARPAVTQESYSALQESSGNAPQQFDKPSTPVVTTGVDSAPVPKVTSSDDSAPVPDATAAAVAAATAAAAAAASTSATGSGTYGETTAPTEATPPQPAPVSTPQRAATVASSVASTPQSSHTAPESPGSSSTAKKDKRRSGFFGRLKEKLKK